MSGGYLDKDGVGKDEHRTIIFNIKGEVSAENCRKWNTIIESVKGSLFDDRLIAVTLNGRKTERKKNAFDPNVKVLGLPKKSNKTKSRPKR